MARSLGCHLRFAAFFCVLAGTTLLCCESERSVSPGPDDPAAVDTLAPARISDLSVARIGSTWVRLVWRAPGDDGDEGRATSYDLRYARPDTTRWESMTPCVDLPEPGAPDSLASFDVVDLMKKSIYRFIIRAMDDAGNWSPNSNTLFVRTTGSSDCGPDTIPPAKISYLRVLDAGPASATIRWWTPGDDGDAGTATAYDIRYAVQPYEGDFWEVAHTVADPPTPLEANSMQIFTIRGLEPNQTYSVGIKAVDEVGNWSEPSSLASVTTRAAGDLHWWDGFAASPEGKGLDDDVRCLVVHDGLLIAGGDFLNAGEVLVNHIAAWDGTEWFPLGQGLSGDVRVLGTYLGQLVACGEFSGNIAIWNGGSWELPGAGVDDRVVAVAEFEGDLVVAGEFLHAGDVEAINIARWNGRNWAWMDDAIGTRNRLLPYVSLAAYRGHLYAAGFGYYNDWSGIVRIVEWDGADWNPWLFCHEHDWPEDRFWVKNLRVIGESLYLCGRSVLCDHPDRGFEYLGRYESGRWTPLIKFPGDGWRSSWGVHDVTEWDGRLVAGGYFVLEGTSGAADIAYFESGTWYPFGSGFRSSGWPHTRPGHDGPVHALAVYQGDLYVGGEFPHAGGTPSKYIARWVE